MALFVSSVAAGELPAGTETESPVIGAEIDFNSKYLWHGQEYSNRSVLQPSVWVSAGELTATLWTNNELSEDLNEINAILEYPLEFKKFLVEPSFSYYVYPTQPGCNPMIELAFKISHPLSEKFSLYTSQNFYFLNGDVGDSYFGGLGLDFETGIAENIKLNVSPFAALGSIKYNRENFGYPEWAFDLISADVSLEYGFFGGWYVKPHFTYAFLPDKNLTENDRSNTAVGIALGAEF